ncbi:uncharacterized protein [Maniola hyperantus]|uniref:uncharacterized protein isoform X2 n=1 Tax=Aphantopus hyperantus TaxID=2795564 RepID=UPI00374A6A7C
MSNKYHEIAKLLVQRWTHLRDNYNRSYKKIQDQKRSGNCARMAKPYIYSKQLSFLNKIIQPRMSISDATTENSNTEFETQNSDTNEGSEIDPIEVTKKPTPKRNAIPKKPDNSEERAREINPVDAKMIKFTDYYSNNEPTVTNRHLSFFNGILPTLNNFDDNEVLEFQIGVLHLLKNIKSSRHNHELPSFRGYFTQEYQVENNAALNCTSRNVTTIPASLKSHRSDESSD